MIGKLASKLFINSVEKRMTEFRKILNYTKPFEHIIKKVWNLKVDEAMGIGSKEDLVKSSNLVIRMLKIWKLLVKEKIV